MPTPEARVPTGNAGRYARRLCKHYAHKILADWAPRRAWPNETG